MNHAQRVEYIEDQLRTRGKWKLDDYRDFYEQDVRFLLDLVKQPQRWHPIDENTPKDRELILGSNRFDTVVIGSWNSTYESWEDEYGNGFKATHWMEKPHPPTKEKP